MEEPFVIQFVSLTHLDFLYSFYFERNCLFICILITIITSCFEYYSIILIL